MIVYRLSKPAFAHDLSGLGTKIAGGRWNSQGIALIYTSESRALCTAEIAVHTGLSTLPSDYQLITINFPDAISLSVIDPAALPGGWRSFPHPSFTQKIGDEFVKTNRYLILKVPSAVVPGDYNYLINPAHFQFSEVKIINSEPFAFDLSMFR